MPAKRFEADWTTATGNKGQPLSVFTVNVYRAAMNNVAKHDGYTTTAQIVSDQKGFVKALERRVPDPDKRRVVLAALNSLIRDVPYSERTILYEAYKRVVTFTD